MDKLRPADLSIRDEPEILTEASGRACLARLAKSLMIEPNSTKFLARGAFGLVAQLRGKGASIDGTDPKDEQSPPKLVIIKFQMLGPPFSTPREEVVTSMYINRIILNPAGKAELRSTIFMKTYGWAACDRLPLDWIPAEFDRYKTPAYEVPDPDSPQANILSPKGPPLPPSPSPGTATEPEDMSISPADEEAEDGNPWYKRYLPYVFGEQHPESIGDGYIDGKYWWNIEDSDDVRELKRNLYRIREKGLATDKHKQILVVFTEFLGKSIASHAKSAEITSVSYSQALSLAFELIHGYYVARKVLGGFNHNDTHLENMTLMRRLPAYNDPGKLAVSFREVEGQSFALQEEWGLKLIDYGYVRLAKGDQMELQNDPFMQKEFAKRKWPGFKNLFAGVAGILGFALAKNTAATSNTRITENFMFDPNFDLIAKVPLWSTAETLRFKQLALELKNMEIVTKFDPTNTTGLARILMKEYFVQFRSAVGNRRINQPIGCQACQKAAVGKSPIDGAHYCSEECYVEQNWIHAL